MPGRAAAGLPGLHGGPRGPLPRGSRPRRVLIVVADPISLAMFRPPGDYDADIVVAEGQPLGIFC